MYAGSSNRNRLLKMPRPRWSRIRNPNWIWRCIALGCFLAIPGFVGGLIVGVFLGHAFVLGCLGAVTAVALAFCWEGQD